MPVRPAKIRVSRSGSSVTIDVLNRNTDKVRIYSAPDYNDTFTVLDEGFQDQFTDTATTRKKYKGQIFGTESKEVINTSTEIINTSTEFIYKATKGIISKSKFTK